MGVFWEITKVLGVWKFPPVCLYFGEINVFLFPVTGNRGYHGFCLEESNV
jgi:hypothetical protein